MELFGNNHHWLVICMFWLVKCKWTFKNKKKKLDSYPAPDSSLKVDHKINSFDKLAERFILTGEAMTKNNSTNYICNSMENGGVGVERFACEYRRYHEYFWIDYSEKNEEEENFFFFKTCENNSRSDYF